MSNGLAAESAKLKCVLHDLEKLLREPNALRDDPISGKLWTDATEEGRDWLRRREFEGKTIRERAAQEQLAFTMVAPSGAIRRRRIEAEYECKEKSIAGFIAARRDVQARLDKVRQTLAKSETPEQGFNRLRDEITRLEADEDLGAAMRIVESAFRSTNERIRRRLPTMLGAVRRVVDELTADGRGIADRYIAKARRELAADDRRRLEAARIEFGEAAAAVAPPKPMTPQESGDPGEAPGGLPDDLRDYLPASTIEYRHGIKPQRLSEAVTAGKVRTKPAPRGLMDSVGAGIRKLYHEEDAKNACIPKDAKSTTRES